MGRIPKLGLRLAVALLALSTAACLNIQPKTLGEQGKFNFDAFNTNGSTTFQFNFALQQTTSGVTTVFLQANNNSKASAIGNCNLAGTGCACTFQDANGTAIRTTSSTEISYDETGNYYRCVFSGTAAQLATVASVVINNNAGTVSSGAIPVKTTLTLAELIGTDLDVRKVRSVFRYQCEFTYLQKSGTTTQGFDCSVPVPNIACDNVGSTTPGNFCLLRARFPFYLFSDTLSTNFFQKIADKIYASGNGNTICGLTIKQIDCVGTAADPWGNPSRIIGLFGQSQGIWTVSVNLPSAPDVAVASFGFAAKTSTVTGECPPGLIKQVAYTTTIETATSITPSHNFPSLSVATEMGAPPPAAAPPPFKIAKFGNGGSAVLGNCNGTSCGMPLSQASADIKGGTQTYSSAGATVLCVIPQTLLDN